MDYQPNCSEAVYRLSGSLEEIKQAVLGMIDTIQQEYKDSKIYRWDRVCDRLRQQVRAITDISQFNTLVITFSPNSETFFRTEDDTLLVATSNSINHNFSHESYEEGKSYSEASNYYYCKVLKLTKDYVVLIPTYDFGPKFVLAHNHKLLSKYSKEKENMKCVIRPTGMYLVDQSSSSMVKINTDIEPKTREHLMALLYIVFPEVLQKGEETY